MDMRQSCKDHYPIMDLVKELGTFFDLLSLINLNEDNVGALLLGKLEPHRMTSRSMHYGSKYNWFQELFWV